MRVEGKLFNFEKKCPRMNKVKPKFICTFQLPILICANYVGREVKDHFKIFASFSTPCETPASFSSWTVRSLRN
jgi:hypothetical protein